MDVRSWGGFHRTNQDLASLEPFDLGPLRVKPALRQLACGDRQIMIEPRVMRVLVALVEADGRVLSRDELIETCWDGRIVGDNAINRVVSRLRQALAELAGDSVRIETITKVGLRLLAASAPAIPLASKNGGGPAPPSGPESSLPRRAATIGIGLLATISLGSSVWTAARRHTPHPKAKDLFERGQIAQKTGNVGTMRQAMSFYKQAIAIDPDYADAWGALAIGYRHGLDGYTNEEKLGYPRLIQSAAARALALDPDQIEARTALALSYPNFRRWHLHERRLRALLRRAPRYWYAHAQMGILMQDVGRFEEAILCHRRTLAIDPMLPIGWAALARAMYCAGRDQDADIALDRAFARWPAHPALWFTRYGMLIAGRRYAEAAAFARDPRSLPDEFPPQYSQTYDDLATALSRNDGAMIDGVVARLRPALDDIGGAPWLAPLLARLGQRDLALAGLAAFFIGGRVEGRRVPPPGSLDLRPTAVLFTPPILELRTDSRHAALLVQTGLEDYWRASGSAPDFRRYRLPEAANARPSTPHAPDPVRTRLPRPA